jgi:cation transport regulator ChaC
MIKFIIVGKKWFDKANGNTYHSARVYDLEKKVIAVAPYEYGYGDQYIYSAFNALKKAGIIDKLTIGHDEYYATAHENCKKAEIKKWGKI